MTSFKEFDGEKVVCSLIENRSLWRSVIMDRPEYLRTDGSGSVLSLMKLRDLSDGIWNVDTLFILPKAGKENALKILAETWNADSVHYIGGEAAANCLGCSAMNSLKQILRVWWD